jgi:hypothetical protein
MHLPLICSSHQKKVSKQGSAVSRGALARHLALFGEISYVFDLYLLLREWRGEVSKKVWKFLEDTADYADFTGRNRENLPDRTTDVASACTKPK